MTEYELTVVKTAIERSMIKSIPGVSEVMRRAIIGTIILRLRHKLNLPAPTTNQRGT